MTKSILAMDMTKAEIIRDSSVVSVVMIQYVFNVLRMETGVAGTPHLRVISTQIGVCAGL